jgi:serine/threonine-protein kinase HipA
MDRIKRAGVYFGDQLAGSLCLRDGKYTFQYDPDYLLNGAPISYSIPLSDTPFLWDQLHPFFTGLLSEGWLLKTQSIAQRIDERNVFDLLLMNGRDVVGAVTIKPMETK